MRESHLGQVSGNKGKHLSEEAKQKLRERNLGKHPSEETKRKRSQSLMGHVGWNKGKHTGPRSEEFKQKTRERMLGTHHGSETIKKLRESHLGKHPSEESIQKRSGERHKFWKGDDAGYRALHGWVKRHKPKPERCEKCNEKKRLGLANVSGEYKRDINDFQWLCYKCHRDFDKENKTHKKGTS